MIDYLKIELPCAPKHILNVAENMGLIKRLGGPTGDSVPILIRLGALSIWVYNEKVVLDGSVHKFYNEINNKGSQNHTDFYHREFYDIITYLGRLLDVNIWKSRIQNLEYGVNVPVDAGELFPAIISLRGREKSSDRSFSGGGRLIEFEFSQIWLKLYNKSAQYGLDKKMTRVEIKARKNQYLNQFGINTLNDLRSKENLFQLKKDIISKVDRILITHSPDEYNSIEEELLFKDGLNPKYWASLKQERNHNKFSRKWNEFNSYVIASGLARIKINLLKQLSDTWDRLTNDSANSITLTGRKSRFLHLGKVDVSNRVVISSGKFWNTILGTFIVMMQFVKSLIRTNAP